MVTLRAYHHSNERRANIAGVSRIMADSKAPRGRQLRELPVKPGMTKSALPAIEREVKSALERTTVHNTSDAPWLTLTTVLLYISFAGRSR